MIDNLPFSQACENNKGPILEVLRVRLAHIHVVLEIGSGNGQHAVHFAPALPHLVWHPGDLPSTHGAIEAWLQRFPSPNLRPPCRVDVRESGWHESLAALGADAVFSANTAHIMHWDAVCSMFAGVGSLLPAAGLFALYGPFGYAGAHTSEGNRAFDRSLRASDPGMGIRDRHALDPVAADAGLHLVQDQAMPANNRLLFWQRQ